MRHQRPNCDQPDKFCDKCGELIPTNAQILEAWGRDCKAAREATPKQLEPPKPRRKIGYLACEPCAILASAGMPKEPRKVSSLNRARHPHADQTIIDVPVIFIS